MVAVPVPPPPGRPPPKEKGPPAEPPRLQDLPQEGGYVVTPVTEIPALTKLVTSVALLGLMSANNWGWKNVWNTIFTRPTHWFGRLFRHFMPNPDRLRKQLEHDMAATASHLFAQQSPGVAKWLHGQAKVVEQATGVMMTTAEWTHDALVILRHTTVPTLIYRATRPLALAINALDTRLSTVEDKLSDATGYINTMLRALPRGTGPTFSTAIRQWTQAFQQLYNSWFDTWLPRVQRLYNIRVPALEQAIGNVVQRLDVIQNTALPAIRARLTALEQGFAGILADPTTWMLGLLGAAMLPALTAIGMRTALRNLTCRNVQTAASNICAQDETLMRDLMTMLFGVAIIGNLEWYVRGMQAVMGTTAGLVSDVLDPGNRNEVPSQG